MNFHEYGYFLVSIIISAAACWMMFAAAKTAENTNKGE